MTSDLIWYVAADAPPPVPPADLSFAALPLRRTPKLYGPNFGLHDADGHRLVDPPVTVEVVTRTFAPVVTLDESHDRSWQESLNEPGSAVLAIDNDDPDLASVNADDHLLLYRLYGAAAFTMLPRETSRTDATPDEEFGEITVFTGPGHVSLCDESLVYPSRGLDQLPIETDRVFNWASPYLDDSGWRTPTAIVQQGIPDMEFWGDMPGNFPSGFGAFWLGATMATEEWAQQGPTYFRCSFTVPDGVDHAIIYFGADAQGAVWLDGQLVLTSEYTASDPTQLYTVIVDVTEGDHLIAVENINDPDPEGDHLHNPGGFVLGMLPIDALGVVPDVTDALLISSNLFPGIWDWKMVDNTIPDGLAPAKQPPGVTPGLVVQAALAEAHTRGELTGVTLIGDEHVDAEGVAWPTVGEIQTKVGNDLLTFLRELSGTYIDYWMAPGSLELHIYVIDGRGRNRASVGLHAPTDPDDAATGNITDQLFKTRPPQANALLVRWNGGWHEVTLPASISTHGRRVGLLSLSVDSLQEAIRIAEKQLAIFGNQRGELSIGLEPANVDDLLDPLTTTDLPYWQFYVGDVLGSPSQRVVQLSVKEDDDGNVTYAPVLNDVLMAAEERWEQAIKKMDDGTMRGDSKVATPINQLGGPTTGSTCCAPQPSDGGGGGG